MIDIYWHILTYIDIYWHILTYIDIYWHILTYIDIYWHILTYIDIYWHILTYIDIYWHILTYIDIYWHILTYIDIYWHILTYIDIYWHILTYIDIHYTLLYCIILFCIILVIRLWCSFRLSVSKHSGDIEMRFDVECDMVRPRHPVKAWAEMPSNLPSTFKTQFVWPGLKIDYIWVRERTQERADRVALPNCLSCAAFVKIGVKICRNPFMTYSCKSQVPCAGFSDWTFLWWSISTLLGHEFLLLWQWTQWNFDALPCVATLRSHHRLPQRLWSNGGVA